MTKLFEKAQIVSNNQIAEGIYKCILQTKKIAGKCLPGNFINLGLGNDSQFLLKRPFGVHDVREDKLGLLYRVRGKGTAKMADFRSGEVVELIGPLGNNFSMVENKRILVLAGGMGVAPLFFLEKELSKKNQVVTLYAVKTRPELAEINFSNLILHVDDEEGCFVCENLEEILIKNEIDVLYVCGPEPLMKSSYEIAKKHGIHTEVSLEARMACGFGACVGCTIETVNGLKKVCDEGPVFNAKDVWG